MDDWIRELRRGNSDAAWDLFLGRYRRLVFSAIRHYARDYDDVMDVFARVCDRLREDNLRRLRTYIDETGHRATFTTWLVTVVRNLTIDWFRHRDGRLRVSALAGRLSPVQHEIFTHVFVDGHSHVATYELVRTRSHPELSFREFLVELREAYQVASHGRRGRILAELGVPLSEALAIESREDDALDPPDVEELERALDTLKDEDRVLVQLFVIDELPAADVARVLGLPNAKAVYNRAYRALASLRQHLERVGVRRERS
jgi:RNA polymerase sigma factor (sigma-70 family)